MKVYAIGLHEVTMHDSVEVEKCTIFLKYEAELNEYHLTFWQRKKTTNDASPWGIRFIAYFKLLWIFQSKWIRSVDF